VAYPEPFHVGFRLESRAAVDALHARLVDAGVEVLMAPRAMRGSWMFYFKAPGDVLVEASSAP
jgi:catechol 2,3-dioxygenase-like lactoylglutathione lyase family enzyme